MSSFVHSSSAWCLRAVFGVKLATILEREKRRDGIPTILVKCIEYIESLPVDQGIAAEGIFRVSANQAEVAAMRDYFNTSTLLRLKLLGPRRSSSNTVVDDLQQPTPTSMICLSSSTTSTRSQAYCGYGSATCPSRC